MSKKPYPSDSADRFIVRMPDGLRDRIAHAAKANNRSMNSEVVATLEEKYPGDDEAKIREIQAIVKKMSPEQQDAFREWVARQRAEHE